MKVAHITFQRSVNYGTYLQCLALQNMLEKAGADVTTIDYQPAYRKDKMKFFSSVRQLVPTRSNRSRFFKMSMFRFDERQSLHLSSRCESKQEFLQMLDKGNYDQVICGGDQIWNATHTANHVDPVYFGCVGEHDVPVSSYSSSFGTTAPPEMFRDEICARLSAMRRVCVREKSSAEWLRQNFSIHCRDVPDPVLLDGKIGTDPRRGSKFGGKRAYFAIYMFRMSSDVIDLINVLGSQSRLEPKYMYSGWHHESLTTFIPRPVEGFSFFKGSSLVLTDSFHGLLCAIMENKPFVFARLIGKKEAVNQRIIDMLDVLNLDQWITQKNICGISLLSSSMELPWSIVNKRIAEYRRTGIDIMNEMLTAPLD